MRISLLINYRVDKILVNIEIVVVVLNKVNKVSLIR